MSVYEIGKSVKHVVKAVEPHRVCD